jgi:hypothetical protein
MSRANHLWGAPHIHGELLKLGFTIAQSTGAAPVRYGGGLMDTLFSEGQSGLKVVLFVIVVLGLLALAFWLLRQFGGQLKCR